MNFYNLGVGVDHFCTHYFILRWYTYYSFCLTNIIYLIKFKPNNKIVTRYLQKSYYVLKTRDQFGSSASCDFYNTIGSISLDMSLAAAKYTGSSVFKYLISSNLLAYYSRIIILYALKYL